MGSSPLARGTLGIAAAAHAHAGLIPARAGNTRVWIRGMTTSRAHPRSRGEHAPRRALVVEMLGSSPLARGTLSGTHGLRTGGGLIPARAGNTFDAYRPASRHGAHPRSRGEHHVS